VADATGILCDETILDKEMKEHERRFACVTTCVHHAAQPRWAGNENTRRHCAFPEREARTRLPFSCSFMPCYFAPSS